MIRIIQPGRYLGKDLKAVKREAGELHEGPVWNEQELIRLGLAEPATEVETVSVETVSEEPPAEEEKPAEEPKPKRPARRRNPFIEG